MGGPLGEDGGSEAADLPRGDDARDSHVAAGGRDRARPSGERAALGAVHPEAESSLCADEHAVVEDGLAPAADRRAEGPGEVAADELGVGEAEGSGGSAAGGPLAEEDAGEAEEVLGLELAVPPLLARVAAPAPQRQPQRTPQPPKGAGAGGGCNLLSGVAVALPAAEQESRVLRLLPADDGLEDLHVLWKLQHDFGLKLPRAVGVSKGRKCGSQEESRKFAQPLLCFAPRREGSHLIVA